MPEKLICFACGDAKLGKDYYKRKMVIVCPDCRQYYHWICVALHLDCEGSAKGSEWFCQKCEKIKNGLPVKRKEIVAHGVVAHGVSAKLSNISLE